MCTAEKRNSWVIPFGGNGFVDSDNDPSPPRITPCGVTNWATPSSNISLYFHVQYPGKVLLALRLLLTEGSSKIKFTIAPSDKERSNGRCVLKESQEIIIEGKTDFQLVNCGTYTVATPGYIQIDLNGIEKTGASYYAEVSHLVVVSETVSLLEASAIRFVEDPEDFYFGRRGPSVHFAWPLPDGPAVEYFYNEIHVPRQQDVIGAYFCAIGFTGGYFGIQVNSETERRILFSVWSEYDAQDPGEVPEEYRVKLIRKGEDVYVGEFGNEGTGAQSYLRYMWQPETTYKFIILGKPIDADRTMFTAWLGTGSDPTTWRLIASFDKPKVSIYFKGPYCFSENFSPDRGHIERHCLFANQWSRDVNGIWREMIQAKFTADETARRERRFDIAGGIGLRLGIGLGDPTQFYLRNCGFFSDMVEPDTEFSRTSSGLSPPVDVSILP